MTTTPRQWAAADLARDRSLLAQVKATDVTTARITKAGQTVTIAGAASTNATEALTSAREALAVAKADQRRDDALALTEAYAKGEAEVELPASRIPELEAEVTAAERFEAATTATLRNAWIELSIEVQKPNYLAKLAKSWDETIGYVPAANARHAEVTATIAASVPHLNALARLALNIANGDGANKQETKRLRDALKARTAPMPTLSTVTDEMRGEVQDTPHAKARASYDRAKASDRARDQATATAAAKARAVREPAPAKG
jgi:hypothetical protein